jgi:hypothetical protein
MRYYSIGVQGVGSYDDVRDDETDAIIGKELVLTSWPDDDILCAMIDAYFVTSRLAEKLQGSRLTGFAIEPVKVVDGDQFWKYRKLYGSEPVPTLRHLLVTGTAGQDDFGKDRRLVVSESALAFLKSLSFAYLTLHGEFASVPNR